MGRSLVTGYQPRLVYDCSAVPSPDDSTGRGSTTMQIIENTARAQYYYDKLTPYFKLKNTSDNTLIFESRFESGNLARATQMYAYRLFNILKWRIRV
jgi:hypothetical protein